MDLLCGLCQGIGGFVAFIMAFKIWYQYTLGRCTSRRRMDGKTVIVTGSNTGIGKETALELAKRGARVILACHDPKRGTQAQDDIVLKTGNKNVYFLQLDLSSLKSVRNFVAEVKRREKQLHVLINNAAAAGMPNRRTEDDLQQEMQINHFGPFLLTILLIDLLKSSIPSRVVIVSSGAHKFAKLELDNLNNERWHSNVLYQYSNAKLANILFSNELALRLCGTGVTCNCLHPGAVQTEIVRRMPLCPRVIYKFIVGLLFKNPVEGAQTSIYLAVAGEVQHVTGKYFSDCKEDKPSTAALDKEFAGKLWDECVRLVKLLPNEIKL